MLCCAGLCRTVFPTVCCCIYGDASAAASAAAIRAASAASAPAAVTAAVHTWNVERCAATCWPAALPSLQHHQLTALRPAALTCRVIASVENGDSEAAARQLEDLLEGQLELFQKGAGGCTGTSADAIW